jgi:hypothetical protein
MVDTSWDDQDVARYGWLLTGHCWKCCDIPQRTMIRIVTWEIWRARPGTWVWISPILWINLRFCSFLFGENVMCSNSESLMQSQETKQFTKNNTNKKYKQKLRGYSTIFVEMIFSHYWTKNHDTWPELADCFLAAMSLVMLIGIRRWLVFRWFQSALSLRGFGICPIIISFPTSWHSLSLR